MQRVDQPDFYIEDYYVNYLIWMHLIGIQMHLFKPRGLYELKIVDRKSQNAEKHPESHFYNVP